MGFIIIFMIPLIKIISKIIWIILKKKFIYYSDPTNSDSTFPYNFYIGEDA